MAGPLQGADSGSHHERVLTTYNFSPHALSRAEIADKSKNLDAFWTDVKARGPTATAALREELARPDSSAFFSYDGAQLLLSISRTRPDEIIALAAAAAFKILSDDHFQAFIPQHALTLSQEDSLTFLLLPTREEFYLAAAEDRLFKEPSIVAQKSLMSLLANTVTKRGDAAIARFAADSTQAAEARAYARTILDTTQKMATIPLLGLSRQSYAELKDEQKQLMGRVSDEALDEWSHLRIQLRHRGPQ